MPTQGGAACGFHRFDVQFEFRLAFAFCHRPSCVPMRSQKTSVIGTSNPRRRRTCGSTEDTIPSGIAVVLPPGEKGYKSGNLEALNNPFVSGVAVQINWRDHRAGPGESGLVEAGCALCCRDFIQEMGTLRRLPGFFLACLGPGRRRDRFVRDTVRTGTWHGRETPHAVGSRIP